MQPKNKPQLRNRNQTIGEYKSKNAQKLEASELKKEYKVRCKHIPINMPRQHGIMYDIVCTKCGEVLGEFPSRSYAGHQGWRGCQYWPTGQERKKMKEKYGKSSLSNETIKKTEGENDANKTA